MATKFTPKADPQRTAAQNALKQKLQQAQKSRIPEKRKRRERRQKQRDPKQNTPDARFETPKQLRADPRIGRNGLTNKIESANQVKALVLTLPLAQARIEEYARGIVMKACEKGLLALGETYDPYFAYRYIVTTLQALISNQAQTAVNVPYAMLAMARGLRAKSCPMGNGTASFAVSFPVATDPAQNTVVGYVPYGYVWTSEPATGVYANIIWPTAAPVGTAYTPDLGAQSFQRLMQIIVDKTVPASRAVLTNARTALDNDVSSFAFSLRSRETLGLVSGGSAANVAGGISTPLSLEVPIRKPMFAATATATDPVSLGNRFGNLHANCAGDGTTLAAGQLSWFDERKWNMQRPPRLHPVDFNEFVDVVAKWVANIQQAYVNDTTNTGDPALVKCTLSLQEMKLCLRNVLMMAFKETQASVHAVYPIVPEDDGDNAFVPFVVGTNTCYLGPNAMRLPVPIIENIRALVYREVWRGGNDFECFIPILGQFNNDDPATEDYTYVKEEEVFESFTTPADLFKKKVHTKQGDVFQPFVETTISMIDGSSSLGQVFINSTAALKETTAKWDEWLNKIGVETYSTGCGILGTEKGINALTSINMTRVCTNAQIARRQPKIQDLVDVRNERNRNTISAPSPIYTQRIAFLDSAQSVILGTAYEQVQSMWILPVFRITINSLNDVAFIKWQAAMDEPYSQALGDGGVELESLHAAYAANCVKGKTAQASDWSELFTTLAAQGRGGILSGIIGNFANMIIPGADKVVKQFGDSLGI